MNHSLWIEKYRPVTIEDCILPDSIKVPIREIISSKDVPNLILSGKPGVGKTSVAYTIINGLQAESLVVNGSKDGNIDTLRTTISEYASRSSLDGSRKFVHIEEGDFLNPKSTQPALRAFIEEFSKRTGFIITCNYKNKIIEPLRKRFIEIDFKFPKTGSEEYKDLLKQAFVRCRDILEKEGVEFDQKAVMLHVKNNFPDMRKTLNELQYLSKNGKIDLENLLNSQKSEFEVLINAISGLNFGEMSRWIDENADIDINEINEVLWNHYQHNSMEKSSLPSLILHMNEYDKNSSFVTNQEINKKAMLISIMKDCEFR